MTTKRAKVRATDPTISRTLPAAVAGELQHPPVTPDHVALREMAKHAYVTLNAVTAAIRDEDEELSRSDRAQLVLRCTQVADSLFTMLHLPLICMLETEHDTPALRGDAAGLAHGLALLAGLHPCLTTDDPVLAAERIFEHVQAERQEAREEHKRLSELLRLSYDDLFRQRVVSTSQAKTHA